MKKRLTLSLFALTMFLNCFSQVPQSFKYQVVVRDNAGDILANQAIGIRIGIHDQTAGGTLVYQEAFSTATNQFGLVNLKVGNGIPVIGTFSTIKWRSGSKFLEIEIDPTGGASYVSMGTSQLLSVPYALYSVASADSSLWGKNGNTIFYNDGNVGIGAIDPAAKLEVSGQVKVTGGNPGDRKVFTSDAYGLASWKSPKINDLTDGVSDTSSVYLGGGSGLMDDGDNKNTAIGVEALTANTTGFQNIAVGYQALYNNTTGYFNTAIGPDALHNNTTGHLNTAIGPRALISNMTGSIDMAIGFQALYSNTTGDNNIGIGSLALYSNTTGAYNTANGIYALFENTTGYENTANGYGSLYSNSTGSYNSAIGYGSLINNTTGEYNTANGYRSLFVNTTGDQNTATGSYSLYHSTTGDWNTAIGYKSLFNNTTGYKNTANGYASLLFNTTGHENAAAGSYSLYKNTTGYYNTASGYGSGYNNTSGINNTCLGYQSGYNNATGSGNVFLGYKAGYYQTGSNKLYIGNDSYYPLIYGEFDNARLNISGSVAIGTTAAPQSKLDVWGNVIIRDDSNGDIVVELGAGLDYAEGFNVTDRSAVGPGTVLCIDPENPGNLVISNQAYDTKVAGIVAGANNLGSGITLGTGSHDFNVALAGRVYCNVETIHHAIHTGDLLTTSGLPGYAMKHTGRKSAGAILGKAMESMKKGDKGRILVLVTLQ